VTYLSLAGVDLYYEVAGQGTPVVLVHGLALDTRMWDDQVEPVAREAMVIRYDARGFGRSRRHDDVTPYTNAQDLWALLDHLDVPAAVLVGLSMGGEVVLEAALEAPDRTLALVLLDSVLDGVPWDEESAAGMKAIGTALREGGLDAAKAAWLSHPFFAPARRDRDTARRLDQMVADYSGIQWTAHDPHGPHPDCPRLLPTIGCPTHVVVGALDMPCFRTMSETIASSVPGARLTVVPDAGHMVNMEAPGVVTSLILDVVRSRA
jgi:pimeloyl-ACP methyl ester carboxylesterase